MTDKLTRRGFWKWAALAPVAAVTQPPVPTVINGDVRYKGSKLTNCVIKGRVIIEADQMTPFVCASNSITTSGNGAGITWTTEKENPGQD